MSLASSPPRLREIHTRFLWPFELDLGELDEPDAALAGAPRDPGGPRRFGLEDARAALLAARLDGAPMWRTGEPPRAYRDEYDEHVRRFLFGEGSGACVYVTLDPALGARWFAGDEVELGQDCWRQLRLIPEPGIELFLSPHGAGVLSITLAPSTEDLDIDVALDFNYRLAQAARRGAARIRKRHPSHDRKAFDLLDPEARRSVKPAPAADAPLHERLVARGGEFDLPELVALLLERLPRERVRPIQEAFCVHTVARLGALPQQNDAQRANLRDDPKLRPFLSSLCQVEESSHAGAPAGETTADRATLNRLHESAVGVLGSAHVVSDQGGLDFDEQRVGIVRDKYFIAYLVALLQRVTLRTALRRTVEAASLARADREARLERIRADLMRLALESNHPEVSSRHAVQRFYELARLGVRVESSWVTLRAAIADHSARALAEKSEQHLHAIERVQHFIHVLEYVLVPVYVVHLAHMFLEAHDVPDEGEHSAVLFTALTLSVLAVFLLDRWFDRASGHASKPDELPPPPARGDA